MSQNTSSAVMQQRHEPKGGNFDDFPTPPWATRALMEFLIKVDKSLNVWEPACGRGYMSETLAEYFANVFASDITSYGYPYENVGDFLTHHFNWEERDEVDWIITNPPFSLAEHFIWRALPAAKLGIAMLVRTAFLEGKGRYYGLFEGRSPSIIGQFVERVPMVKGRCDPKASTASSYCWLILEKSAKLGPFFKWIPPCRKQLERPGDYIIPNARPDVAVLGSEAVDPVSAAHAMPLP
jgi:hypothetical protein